MADLTRFLGPQARQPFIDKTLDTYMTLVDRAIDNGKPTPAPSSMRELEYLIGMYPLRAIPFLPSRDELERLGLSRNTCREDQIEPFSVEWRESFLETMDTDPAFAEAVRLRLAVIDAV